MSLRKVLRVAIFSGLATALFSAPLYANTNVDFKATVQKDTCQIEIDGNGTVSLATVAPSYFADGITAETDYKGGKEFSIKLISCPVSDGAITNVTFNFLPLSGQFPASSKQVFANDLTQPDGGAANVGVVIFTNDSPRVNVLNSDGTSRATFNTRTYSNSEWTFYARMQKIISSEDVDTGLVRSNVLFNVSYQ